MVLQQQTEICSIQRENLGSPRKLDITVKIQRHMMNSILVSDLRGYYYFSDLDYDSGFLSCTDRVDSYLLLEGQADEKRKFTKTGPDH